MKELTKAEEQVMQELWALEKGFVKDIIARMDDPKPAYSTVATIVRILEDKGFVSHKAYGKTHEYFPLISKEEYTNAFLKSFIGRYFGHSYQSLVSFLVRERSLSLHDLEEIRESIGQEEEKGEGDNG